MKKTLSLILAVVMIAALAVVNFPVSAAAAEIGDVAEGYTPSKSATAVSTADEFAAMEAEGNYYLANDIDLSTLAKPYYNGSFAGTLDGCGHTITLAGYAAFKSTTGATLKNIKTAGTVDTNVVCTTALGDPGNDAGIGGFTQISGGGIFYNLVNGAEINYSGAALVPAAGIYGKNIGADVFVVNCKNVADITTNDVAGGIVSFATTDNDGIVVTIAGCVNEGNVTATSGYAGGIVGRGRSVNYVYDCVNTGTITAYKQQAAGIVGYHWTMNATLTISRCENKGKCVIQTDGPDAGVAAGILGGFGNGGSNSVVIEYCYNSGEMVVDAEHYGKDALLCGIVGRDSRTAGTLDLLYCVNAADITDETGVGAGYGLVGFAKFATTLDHCINAGKINCMKASYSLLNAAQTVTATGTYYIDFDAEGLEIANTELEGVTAVLADDIASGKLAFDLNEELGETVFYQNLEEDAAPVPLANRDTVIDNGDGTFNNEPTETEETTLPFEEETEPDDGEDSGEDGDVTTEDGGDDDDEPAQTTTKDNTDNTTKPADDVTTTVADGGEEGGVNVGLIIGIIAGVLVIAAVVVVIVIKGKKKAE